MTWHNSPAGGQPTPKHRDGPTPRDPIRATRGWGPCHMYYMLVRPMIRIVNSCIRRAIPWYPGSVLFCTLVILYMHSFNQSSEWLWALPYIVREARLRFVTSLRAPSLRPLVTRRLRRDDLVASQGQPLERIAYKVRSGVTGSHKGSLSKELHASLTHGRACPLRKTPTMLGNMQGTRS